MKQPQFFLLAICIFCISATTSKNTYTLSKDFTVTINGTSNLHSWNEKVTTVSGDGIINWEDNGNFEVFAINIKMDVHSIQSDMGSAMNNKTYKALKADANPEIIFELKIPVASIQTKSNGNTIAAKGNLTIAGVTKAVDMQVKVLMEEKGKLTVEGAQIIKMSDYNIDPPTALFGTLKTGNEITINFKTNFIIN
ncbi:MAG TPA: YceI family protein [Ferruginibacter sp.]|nr:YceI family protein [Ferruginibacter sp.]